MEAIGDLSRINFAISEYEKKYGRLPPAYVVNADGKPAHSWRVLILEFLDPDLFRQYDFREAWDSPRNRQIASRIPKCYCCSEIAARSGNFSTRFVVISGEGTLFDSSRSVSRIDLRDDLVVTLLVVESVNSKIHWMEPRDLALATASIQPGNSAIPGISTERLGGPAALFADGSRRFLSQSLDQSEIRALATVYPGKEIDPETLQKR